MDAKIQELTEKIYNEGVKQGQAEADRLIAEAETRAGKIEADATARAEEIIKSAERRASELKKTQSQSFASIRHSSSIPSRVVSPIRSKARSLRVAYRHCPSDPAFIRSFILKIAERFDLTRGVEISTADAEGLRSYFTSHAKSLLESGVSIRSVAW